MSANNNNLLPPISKVEVEVMVPDDISEEIIQKAVVDLSGVIRPNSTSEDIAALAEMTVNRIKTLSRYLRLVKALNLD